VVYLIAFTFYGRRLQSRTMSCPCSSLPNIRRAGGKRSLTVAALYGKELLPLTGGGYPLRFAFQAFLWSRAVWNTCRISILERVRR
jgi:hypothetical protein